MNPLRPFTAALAAVMLSLAGCALFLAAATVLSEQGPDFLTRRDGRVAELTLGEAERLEDGGLLDEAEGRYARSLTEVFAGPDKRAYANRRHGELLHRLGRHGEAAEALEKACSGPEPDCAGMAEHLDSLLRAGQWNAAEDALARWAALAGKEAEPPVRAAILAAEGRLLEHAGRSDEALERYRVACRLDWAGDAHFFAGRLLIARGEPAEGSKLLLRYLLHAPKAAFAAEALALLGQGVA